MTNSNDIDEVNAGSAFPRRSTVDNSQILQQLSAIQAQLSQLADFSSRMEDKLLLVSDIYRYENLQAYLQKQDWFEADLETVNIILDIAGKDQDNLKPDDVQHFPVGALKVIDKLWRTYSDNRFGFSIQLRIYQDLGGTLETTIANDRKLIEKWGEQLGWREKNQWKKCEDLNYSLSAAVGCHPSQWWNSPYGSKMTNYFLGRLMQGKL